MSVIALIPARGGSKRVPRKNIADCAGKPLLAWTAEAVRASRHLDRAILSTDDEEVAALGRELGLEVPFLRPADIADDQVPMLPVMQHALQWASDQGEEVEAQVLLQPTSPLRQGHHIDEAIEAFRATGAESLVSVVEVPHTQHPLVTYKMTDGRLAPYIPDAEPETAPPAYARNGPAVMINRPEVIQRGERLSEDLVAYVMAPEDSLDIDTPLDLAVAAFLLEQRDAAARGASATQAGAGAR